MSAWPVDGGLVCEGFRAGRLGSWNVLQSLDERQVVVHVFIGPWK